MLEKAPFLPFRNGAFFVVTQKQIGGQIMHDKNYEDLANAIIIQAVKDYRRTKSPQVRNEIKRFFKSEWFTMLSNVDGDIILKKLEERDKF